MLKTRIAVLVSGGGTNLQALLDARQKVLNSGEIVLVLSNKENAYALTRAENAGIPAFTINKKNLGSQERFEEEMLKKLHEYNVDLIVLAGFLNILSPSFIQQYPQRILNIHPSLIPSFCGQGMYGLKVHQAALDYGVKVSGATVHYVNEVPDGGQIIAQKAVYIEEGDTPEILQKRIMENAEWVILPQAVEAVCAKIAKEK